MTDKLLDSKSTGPAVILVGQSTREKRKTLSVTWMCCAIALIAIVLLGFAFLLRNFFGHWPNVTTSFLGGPKSHPDTDLPVYPYMGKGHSYDTAIPDSREYHGVREGGQQQSEPEIVTRATDRQNAGGDQLFSENTPVKLRIVRRALWGAHDAKRKSYFQTFALDKAIVLETATESCYNEEQCSQIVRNIQKSDMKMGLDDIRYNMLVGGDGSIYEGRGFQAIGEHTPKFSNTSLGIAVIGRFEDAAPSDAQVASLRKLLQYSIAWEYLKSNYELFGYDQLLPRTLNGTTNPGTKLFSIIRKWPHWTENNYYKTN